MAALLCSSPWWTDGHVSACVEIRYLGFFIPVAASLTSVVLICLWHFRLWNNKISNHSYEPLATDEDDGDNENTPHAESEPWRVPQCSTMISWRLQILEAFLLSVDIIIGTVLLIHSHHWTLLLSIYPLAILAIRLLRHSSKLRMVLRGHSEALYCVQWLCIAPVAHAALTDQTHGRAFWAAPLRLGLITGLVLVHWTASRAPSKQQEDAWDGDGDSGLLGRDETASLLSRLFFSWLDPLLWKAFRAGPLEPVDLYPLSHRLVSAIITQEFRAKSSSSLSIIWRAFHLLKLDLLRQGMWAALTGVLVFAPPYLIKLILEYLESPGDTRTSTAWVFVLGLFVSSAVAGIAESQCGWVGYIISAKLRAVLLEQIYGKVLRRRMVRSAQPSDKNSVAESQYASDGSIFNFVSGVCWSSICTFFLGHISERLGLCGTHCRLGARTLYAERSHLAVHTRLICEYLGRRLYQLNEWKFISGLGNLSSADHHWHLFALSNIGLERSHWCSADDCPPTFEYFTIETLSCSARSCSCSK